MSRRFYLPVAILLLSVMFQHVWAQSTAVVSSAGKNVRTGAGVDLRLHHRLSQGNLKDENISLLVKGDLQQIEALTLKFGGVYKNAYGNIASIELPEKNVLAFAASQGIQKIENTSTMGRQLMDTSRIRNNVDSVQLGFAPLPAGLKGKDVVVGIIDGGFYFQHMDFRNPVDSTTRIKYIWDQQVSSGNVPGPYNYGTEWTAANIDAGTCTHVPPPSDFGHGTCVTGIAAGNGHSVYGTPHQGKYTGIAPEADIIAVRVRNGNNFFASVVDAVDYIFKKADSLGKPCVINTSIGNYWGSHDGLDLTSQAIDAMITAQNGRALVAAAGNGGNVPFHLSYPIQPDSTFTFFKCMAPTDEAYFDFWADTADFKDAYFAIGKYSNAGVYKGRTAYFNIPIDFNPTPGNDVFPVYDVFNLSGAYQGTVFMRVALDGSRYQVEVFIDYTQGTTDLWSLQMKGAGTFDLWASVAFTGSSDMTSSTTLGPITHPAYRHPDNYKTMVTSWQNSEKVITVGNYSNRASYVDYNSNTVNLLGSPYFETVGQRFATSSLGPTRDNRVKPDVMATGSTTICTGDAVYISGLLSNSQPEKVSVTGKHVRNGGTSMASPVVAGIVALYLEQNPNASYSEIKEALICTANQDAFTGAVPNREYGNGKVNGFAAITRPCIPIVYGSLDTGCLNYNPLANTDTGCVAKVYGVMDTACLNYNPLANVSGGVCTPKVYGVMDTACLNYNPLANVSGGVCNPKVYGVMDTACVNYNPLANVSGGVCVPKVYGITDTSCLNYNPLANVSSGVCTPKVYGVMDTACVNYNPLANVSGGVCTPKVYGVMDTACLNYNPLANVSGGVCSPKVYGVMDTACVNYNPLANVDGGTCVPKVYGITDTSCLNYNPLANVSGGICDPKIYGVMDTACINYNPLANVSGGVCTPKVYGVMDTACINYNPLANVDGGTCTPKVYGITDTSCLNYNPLANVSGGVCTPKVYGVMDTACFNYNPLANVSGGACTPKVYGITDTACINYNPLANVSSGVCTPKVYGVMDTACLNYNPLANVSGGVCTPKVYGITDTACINYNPLANVSSGICTPKVYGVMDTACLNYNPLANVSGGVCSPKVYGVMDTACINYNPLANMDGGTCTPKVYGITDTTCLNYNPLANVSGGVCTPKVYGIMDTSCINYNPQANIDNGICVAKVYGATDTGCVNYNALANVDNGACVAKVYGVMDTSCINYSPTANTDNGACVAKVYGVTDTSCINYSAAANVDNGACVAKIYGSMDSTCANYNALANVDNGCLTSINDVAFDKVSVRVMPNPFSEQTMFVIDGLQFKTGSIRIYNQLGALIDEFALTSGQYQYNYRNNLLAKAIYNYLLVADGKNIKAGKLVVE